MVKDNPNSLRFINRKTNKVRFFSKHLANDARWKKMTGFEPQPLINDPIEAKPVGITTPPNLHEVGQTVEVKPKRKYTKKKKD